MLDLILSLLYVTVLNGVLLLFCLIAYISARKGRYPWGWYMIGAATQGFSIFGSFFLYRQGALSFGQFGVGAGSFFALLILFWILVHNADRRAGRRNPTPEPKERYYVCEKCGQLVREGTDCDCEVCTATAKETEVLTAPQGIASGYAQECHDDKPVSRIILEERNHIPIWCKLTIGILSLVCIALIGICLWMHSTDSDAGANEITPVVSADRVDAGQEKEDAVESTKIAWPIVPVENGEIIDPPYDEGLAPLTIKTSGSDNYYIVLRDLAPESEADTAFKKMMASREKGLNGMSFFVAGGQSAEVLIPLGEYEIFYTAGKDWYGSHRLFNEDTQHYKCEGTFAFEEKNGHYQGWTLELYEQANGNMDTIPIDKSDFPG